jgi:nitrate reductase beta subunit
MLTAGDPSPVALALKRMFAMRIYQRGRHVDGTLRTEVLRQVGLTANQVEEMYKLLAIANYEDRFVIPSTHREYAEDAFDLKGSCGFSFGNGCSHGVSEPKLFGAPARKTEAV